MSAFEDPILQMEYAIYAAAFVKILDEANVKRDDPDRQEFVWLRAHDFATAAVEAFRGVRQLRHRHPIPFNEGSFR